MTDEQSRESFEINTQQNARIDSLEHRVDRLETLSLTLAENQHQAQESLIRLSASVETTNVLVGEAWGGIKKGAPILMTIFLAVLGLGSRSGVM